MKKSLLAALMVSALSPAFAGSVDMSAFDAAHVAGFLGQGTVIGTSNAHNLSVLQEYAPSAYISNETDGKFKGSFVFRETALDPITMADLTKGRLPIDMVLVKGGTVNGGVTTMVFDQTGYVRHQPSDASKQASFNEVVGCNGCSRVEKEAYLTGSASVLMSKFVESNATQIVDKMDASRTTEAAFSLERALAPASLE